MCGCRCETHSHMSLTLLEMLSSISTYPFSLSLSFLLFSSLFNAIYHSLSHSLTLSLSLSIFLMSIASSNYNMACHQVIWKPGLRPQLQQLRLMQQDPCLTCQVLILMSDRTTPARLNPVPACTNCTHSIICSSRRNSR